MKNCSIRTNFSLLLFAALIVPSVGARAQGPGAVKAEKLYSSTGRVQVDGLIDNGGQLYNVRAHGAKGDGVADDTAAIQSTINALPPCTQAGKTWSHCGKVYLPSGRYRVSSALKISSPFIDLDGAGVGSTTISYTGTSGCAIEWTSRPFNTVSGDSYAGTLSNLAIVGNAASGICGLETYDIVGVNIRNVSISDFTGTGSSGWWDTAIAAFNERFGVLHMTLENNTVDWLVQNKHTDGHNDTFGYGEFDLRLTTQAGQTGVKSLGADSSNPVYLDHSTVSIIQNGKASSCAVLNTQSHWRLSGAWHCEGISMVAGFQADSTSSLAINGLWDSPGPDTGTILAMTPDEAAAKNFLFENPVPATSSASHGSPAMVFQGSYWTGSASAKDRWALSTGVNSGTDGNSVLVIQHFGSPGSIGVQVPALYLPAGTGRGHTTSTGPASARDFPKIAFPDAAGTVALQGANGISSKSAALSGGSYTSTFSAPCASAPNCVASDNTAANPVRVETPGTTSVKVDGASTDTVTIICTPAAISSEGDR